MKMKLKYVKIPCLLIPESARKKRAGKYYRRKSAFSPPMLSAFRVPLRNERTSKSTFGLLLSLVVLFSLAWEIVPLTRVRSAPPAMVSKLRKKRGLVTKRC